MKRCSRTDCSQRTPCIIIQLLCDMQTFCALAIFSAWWIAKFHYGDLLCAILLRARKVGALNLNSFLRRQAIRPIYCHFLIHLRRHQRYRRASAQVSIPRAIVKRCFNSTPTKAEARSRKLLQTVSKYSRFSFYAPRTCMELQGMNSATTTK